MITITIVAEKGGVAKTTTAQALIEELRGKGYKVLGIDLDQQANLTYSFDMMKAPLGICEALESKASFKKAIYKDFLRASDEEAFSELNKKPLKALADALESVKSVYDFCIIDTPPKLDITLAKALVSANYVIIPTRGEAFSVKGVEKTLETIEAIKEDINPSLEIAGLLLTFYNSKSSLNTQIRELLEKKALRHNTRVFKATIRRSIAIGKAQALQEPLNNYLKEAKAVSDYKDFVKELLRIIKKGA